MLRHRGYKKESGEMRICGIEFYEEMRDETRTCMEETLAMLENENLINQLDSVAWNMLAHNLDIFLESKDKLKPSKDDAGMVEITDRGNLSVSPYFTINAKVQSLIQNLMKELGLTPAARAKMKKDQGTEEESPLERLLRGEAN